METKPYNIMPSPEYVIVKLIGCCDLNSFKMFQADMSAIVSEQPRHLIFNCEDLLTLSKDWIRELLAIQTTLKASDKLLRLQGPKSDLKKDLKEKGLDTALVSVTHLREALTDFGLVTKNMLDIEFINPFLNATLHVLKVQASVTAEPGKIFAKKPGDKNVGDISGVIGIVSDSFNGSVNICFPEKTFLNIMGGMLGEVYTEINSEIVDGAGEITNMIFGQAKIVLNEKGYGIKIALPTVVSGKDHSVSSNAKGVVVIVPFTSTAGNFFVEICLSA